ncbi:phage tail tape measure protein [Campylobacter curvus]|uniref:phage tail tape measure protein n=1 Tax=Campylobacter curvus TaxID=200 RepID=UPI00146FD61E|nr:phage tail tape measure protein [Campylobacter curvus]
MRDEAIGISIGLAVKGLSQIDSLKRGFAGLKSGASEAKKAIATLDKTKLSNLQASIRETKSKLISELSGSWSSLANSALLGGSIKLAIDDEAAFANVRKYVDDSEENLTRLKGQMREVSARLGESFTNIANIAAGGGKINLKGEELIKYTQLLATGSVAFEMSAEALSAASNNMKVGFKINDVDKMSEFFDAVNLLDNKVTNANANEIFEATARTAANANLIGLNEKDASAISATMLSTGKEASVVGTSLNALYSGLSMADKKGKAFQEALQSIGLDAGYLKTALQKDAAGAITLFLEQISKADKSKQAGLLYDLVGGNFSDEIAGLVTNIDELKKNIAMANSSEAKGSMQAELQTKLNTTKSAIERLTQSWRNLGSVMGEAFLPFINLLADGLGKFAGWVSKLSSEFPRLSKVISYAIGGFLLFKPLLLIGKIALLSLADGFLSVVKAIGWLNPLNLIAKARWLGHATSLLAANIAAKAHAANMWLVGTRLKAAIIFTAAYSTASKALGATMAFLRTSILAAGAAMKILRLALISTGIGALVVGIGMAAAWLIENWDKVKVWFSSFSDWLGKIFDPVVEWFKNIFGGFFDWISEKFAWISDTIGTVGDTLGSAWKGTKEFFGFGDEEESKQESKQSNESFFGSMFGEKDTPQIKQTAKALATTSGNITINLNGGFNIATSEGRFDLSEFERALTQSVKRAIQRDQFNQTNTEIRE